MKPGSTGTTERMAWRPMTDLPLPFRHIGLTGGIASGKSKVAEILARHGATILDADLLAREVVEPDRPALVAIRQEFGDAVVKPDGTLDRQALAAIVFADPARRRQLEAIVHPAVRALARLRVRTLAKRPDSERPRWVVEVVPLLYEVGLQGEFDEVWVVACSPPKQIDRLRQRDGLDLDAARARLSAQWPIADKLARADRVIDNGGSLEDLERTVAATIRDADLE